MYDTFRATKHIAAVLCSASAWYQRKKNRTPGTSERFVVNCRVGPSTRGQGDSASLVKPTRTSDVNTKQ